jgi:hypothetical protein
MLFIIKKLTNKNVILNLNSLANSPYLAGRQDCEAKDNTSIQNWKPP